MADYGTNSSIRVGVTVFSILFAVIFGIAYTAVSSIGIKTYNECKAIQGNKKWDNMHLLLANTLVIGIMIPVVLLTQFIAGGRVTAAITMLYGIMGLVGSSVAYALTQESECKGFSKESEKNYLIVGIVMSILVLLGGGAYMGMSK